MAASPSSTSDTIDAKRRLTLKSSPLHLAPQTNTKPMTFHLGEEVIGGFAAGVVGTLLGFPLDLVKTRMQTQASSTSSSVKQRGPMSLLTHILRTEGLAAMYKGVGPPLVSLSIVNTLSFTSYSYFRQNLFHGQDGWDFNNAFAGMLGAPIFGLVTTPENFLKTQMQLDNVQAERAKAKQKELQQSVLKQNLSAVESNIQKQSLQQLKPEGRFTSSFQCARALVSSHGATILYTGHVINTVREAAFVGAYFFCYEGYKVEFTKLLLEGDRMLSSLSSNYSSNSDSSWATSLAIPIAGGFSGATSWFLTFPMDCVRAGVQGQLIPASSSTPIQKQGALETFTQLLKNKGLTGLYAGVAPSIARAFLVSGSRFSAYEGALYLCRISGFTTSERGQYKDGAANYDN